MPSNAISHLFINTVLVSGGTTWIKVILPVNKNIAMYSLYEQYFLFLKHIFFSPGSLVLCIITISKSVIYFLSCSIRQSLPLNLELWWPSWSSCPHSEQGLRYRCIDTHTWLSICVLISNTGMENFIARTLTNWRYLWYCFSFLIKNYWICF